MPNNQPIAHTITALDEWFASQLRNLASFKAELEEHLTLSREAASPKVSLSEATRKKLTAIAISFLKEHRVVDGCGLIFAHSAFNTTNGHLEWWVREDEKRFENYVFGVVPGGERYYDYEQHDWFLGAYHQGVPTITGPYIDYLGVEGYLITMTMPVIADGMRVGAVGIDIQMSDLERELLPLLVAHDECLVVVNKHGTVVLSNSEHHLPGTYLDADTLPVTQVTLSGAADHLLVLHRGV